MVIASVFGGKGIAFTMRGLSINRHALEFFRQKTLFYQKSMYLCHRNDEKTAHFIGSKA